MPIDPREFKRFRHFKPAPIEHDRPCRHCGYNLRGLAPNGVCPECGTPIERPSGGARLRDSLSDAPLHYLRLLLLGVALMVIGSIGGVAVLYGFPAQPLKAVALLTAAATWWLGVYIVTRPRETGPNAAPDDALDSDKFRFANRILQASWIGVGLLWFGIVGQPGAVANTFLLIAILLAVLGLFSLVPLSFHLAALGDWSGDTSLANRFRGTAWALAAFGLLAIGGVAMGMLAPFLGGFVTLAISAASIGLFICQIVFLIWLLQLCLTAQAAITSANFTHETDRRRRERLLRGGETVRTCPSCGYSLAGLPSLARCPECGWVDPEVRSSPLSAIAERRERE